MRSPLPTALAFFALALAACGEDRFTEPEVLGGEVVPAEVLNRGHRLYMRYCVTCHGEEGDGRGIAARGQWPPPRDLRTARFKFAGIQDRGLPHDDELARIVVDGLAGTSMLPWDIPEAELGPILQYVKTFSPEERGFRSSRLAVKKPEIPPDPLAGATAEARAEAIARGERLYHSIFECAQCHPSYVEPERFESWGSGQRLAFPYDPVPKWESNYDSVLLPPDFLRHPMRSVRLDPRGESRADDLYRVIAYGLQGPMPGYGHLGEADVWAVAHYVKTLLDRAGSDEGRDLAARMRAWAGTRETGDPEAR